MSNSYSLFCLFADDVRVEVSGKQIVIGMYQGGMNISGKLPATLPQFNILAHLLVPPNADPIEHLQIIVEHAGKVLIDVAPPVSELKANIEAAHDQTAMDSHVLQLSVGLLPFFVEQAGKLTVKAIVNRELQVQGNSLTIRHGPVPGAPTAPSTPQG